MTTSGSADDGGVSGLASMFDAARVPPRLWRSDELSAVLRHQLAAPLVMDLSTLRGVTAEHVKHLAAGGGADPSIHTFHDLLRHPDPPVELLELTKRFAKLARRTQASIAVPAEVAGVLYFASILVAQTRCGVRISNLSDEQLSEGVQWVLAQVWIDPPTRALFAREVE